MSAACAVCHARHAGPPPRTVCDACRNRLVEENLPLAFWCCRRLRQVSPAARRLPREDCQQVALQALVEAAGRWEPSRGRLATLVSYAVRSHVYAAARHAGGVVSLPTHFTDATKRVVRGEETIQRLMNALAAPASLGEASHAAESLPAREAGGGGGGYAGPPLREVLDAAGLTWTERRVLWLAFRWGRNQREIAWRTGVTHQAVSQARARGLRKVRRLVEACL